MWQGLHFFGQILIDFHPVEVPTFAGFYVPSCRGPHPHVCIQKLFAIVMFSTLCDTAPQLKFPPSQELSFLDARRVSHHVLRRVVMRLFLLSSRGVVRRSVVSSCLRPLDVSLSCLPVVLHRVLEVPCVFRVCWCCHVSSYVVLSWSHGPVGPHVLVSGILSLRVFCWHCDSCLFLGSWL